ncbi:MAG: DUF4058 family protein [Leptolyngbyaceae cyanobacterium SM1_1_3]|nr:DUF4058 family protein [Leptolyngbyaceae cyanobacterium SM1_1_3]NJN01774.1 DUF4058 family protein [Leptolyngbyaceae cyanobacterium RM1_1_2]NJO09953.1 DUF4058 family protein [Leptolyngbyaceae cyanobacterium SL_1_1]
MEIHSFSDILTNLSFLLEYYLNPHLENPELWSEVHSRLIVKEASELIA